MAVNSVLGPIDPPQLGYTMMHEHLQVGWTGWDVDSTWKNDRAERLAICTDRLQELRDKGVRTFVDPCPMELGRDPEFMAEVSQRTSVQIICTTGLYKADMGIPEYYRQRSLEEIEELYVRDLTDGIAETGIRAGLIKCATSLPGPDGLMHPEEIKVLTAAGRAARQTGCRIITHTDEATQGDRQLDLFVAQGVEPQRCAIGHSDGTANLRYHYDLLERGCFVSFDRIGIEAFMPDRVRMACIIGLSAVGYANGLFMSQDHQAYWLGKQRRGGTAAPPPEWLAKRRFPYLIEEFIPALIDAGLRAEDTETMMVENPRRFFSDATP